MNRIKTIKSYQYSGFPWEQIVLNNVLNRLYYFQIGAPEYGGSISPVAKNLDLIEYDIATGNQYYYQTTNNKYKCSYGRTISISSNGRYVVVTNSPENTVSILDLVPGKASQISGASSVCPGTSNIKYTVPNIINADTYIWTLPNGATGTSDSNEIVVNYTDSAFSGIISVKGHNRFGDGGESNLSITVKEIPITPHIVLNGNVLQSDADFGNQWWGIGYYVPHATNSTYTPIYKGNYYVVVTINSCPSNPSNVIYYTPNGFEEDLAKNQIELYPNPTFKMIEVKIKTPLNSNYTVEIYNYLGVLIQTIWKEKSESIFTIDLAKCPKGQYLLRIVTPDMLYQHKVIKI